MTLEDANKLLALAKANYSYAFKTMSTQDKMLLVHSWAFALQDIPADIVMIAFMKLLSTSKWLPTVAEIREKVKKLYYESCDHDEWARSEGLLPEESPQKKAAREYIQSQTSRLRGDTEPELGLDAILNGPMGYAIGSGAMADFERLGGGGNRYLTDLEDGNE